MITALYFSRIKTIKNVHFNSQKKVFIETIISNHNFESESPIESSYIEQTN